MPVFECWQAPDRDSPVTARFKAEVELGRQLQLLLRMEGQRGTREEDVLQTTGLRLSRPRRWHKFFERMGVLFQGNGGNTQLTDLGRVLIDVERNAERDFRRHVAEKAIRVLRKYQLKNPADETNEDHYPDDSDLHPYWAVWKAAIELDGRLHWDELNRVLMKVLRHQDLDEQIEAIRGARTEPGYDPKSSGTAAYPLGDRCYQAQASSADRDPEGQLRDHITTPWFKRASFGELLLESPGGTGEGYWTVPDDIADILRDEVSERPPFRQFIDEADWFTYFGSLGESPLLPMADAASRTDEVLDILLARKNVVVYGPPGTGKTHSALTIAREWARRYGRDTVFQVTFHPSYSYEDFVQGFRPVEGRPAEFRLQPGILLVSCDKARELADAAADEGTENSKVLLIIDEINRGDVARIFGELITYIEADKRGISCRLAQSSDEAFWIPENLYFLGTMNTADKSISLLDVALRRRFAFLEFAPDPTSFGRVAGWRDTVDGISVGELLEALNQRLASEGIEADRAIGQALLSLSADDPNPVAALHGRFRLDIYPLVVEYCYVDRARVRRILGDLVRPDGTLRRMSDVEFVNAVRQLLRPEGASADAVEEPSPVVDDSDSEEDTS